MLQAGRVDNLQRIESLDSRYCSKVRQPLNNLAEKDLAIYSIVYSHPYFIRAVLNDTYNVLLYVCSPASLLKTISL